MTGMIEENTGKINQDTGKINQDTGKINQDTGKINQDTGKMENSAGLIDDNTGLITETKGTEYTANVRRKRSRERGKDTKPRNFPLHTLKNLPQFRNKSHEDVRQYILQTKGMDIGSNFNWNKTIIWILIVLAIALSTTGIWKWLQRKNIR